MYLWNVFLVMVDFSRSRRLHGSWVWVLVFHYLISLRSNDFHDYVNWLIIGTLGMAGNCCTGLWIPIGCNDSSWRFHVSNGDRASDIFNFLMFWTKRLLWRWTSFSFKLHADTKSIFTSAAWVPKLIYKTFSPSLP